MKMKDNWIKKVGICLLERIIKRINVFFVTYLKKRKK